MAVSDKQGTSLSFPSESGKPIHTPDCGGILTIHSDLLRVCIMQPSSFPRQNNNETSEDMYSYGVYNQAALFALCNRAKALCAMKL